MDGRYTWYIENLPEHIPDLVREYWSPFKAIRQLLGGWKPLYEAYSDHGPNWADSAPDEHCLYIKYYAHRSNLMCQIRNRAESLT